MYHIFALAYSINSHLKQEKQLFAQPKTRRTSKISTGKTELLGETKDSLVKRKCRKIASVLSDVEKLFEMKRIFFSLMPSEMKENIEIEGGLFMSILARKITQYKVINYQKLLAI